MQSLKDLIHSCVLYVEQQSYLQPRIDHYKSMWKSGMIPFMAEKSIRYYDASVGEDYIQTHIHIAEGKITSYQKDFIRSILS